MLDKFFCPGGKLCLSIATWKFIPTSLWLNASIVSRHRLHMAAANRDLSPELGTGVRFSGAAHNLEAFVTEQPRVNVLWELEDSESQENSYASGHTDWCPAVCCREVKHVSAFVELLRCFLVC